MGLTRCVRTGWMDAARDATTHEQVPTASKFPGGFKKVIDHIHALPMKFGLYTAMGVQTCGKFAASCGHEALDAKTYAGWGVDFVKDDACGNCGTDTTLEAYAAMQQGIWASGRSMVLSFEGQPDPKQSSECGYGQMRRVGHDMVNTYKSAIGLVDLGSRLFPFAHNGSKYNATCGGFWNDLEILHIGDGEFAHSYNGPEGASPGSVAANSHFTMWVVCKAPLLLGMDFSQTAPETLALVKNAEAIAINQDALGVQARRVAITPASNKTFGATKWDGTAVLQPCKARKGVPAGSVASADAPLWTWKNTTAPGPAKFLFISSCNATDAHQHWLFPAAGHEGQLKNVAMATCLDANASSDPAGLAACSSVGSTSSSQVWTLHENGRLSAENMKVCLSIWSSVGPDVALAFCKSATSPHDENEVFAYDAATKQLKTNSSGKEMCVTAMKAPPSGLLSTIIDGKEYCLVQQSNVEGGLSGEPCPTSATLGGKSPFSYHPVPVAGKPELATLFGAPGPDWNNDAYGSGPHPHTRYITPNGGCCGPAGGTTWRVNYSKLAAGEAVQLEVDSDAIVDDDGIGGVSTTGGFCMGLTTFGGLEVWAGPLVDGKIAVTLFNRSPAAEEITAHWSDIGAAVGSYSVRDVWAAVDRGKATTKYSAVVEAHATMLLVLTPTS
jgi:hypothetical protein